jgi:hypothetical protein
MIQFSLDLARRIRHLVSSNNTEKWAEEERRAFSWQLSSISGRDLNLMKVLQLLGRDDAGTATPPMVDALYFGLIPMRCNTHHLSIS